MAYLVILDTAVWCATMFLPFVPALLLPKHLSYFLTNFFTYREGAKGTFDRRQE